MKAKIFTALLAFLSVNVCSSELIGKNINGAYQWMGINQYGGWSPNYWDLAMRLPPTDSIILGGAKFDKDTIDLKKNDAAGNSISVKASILAIQYQIASGASNTSLDTGEITVINGNEVTVKTGEHKVGDKEISFPNATQTPFTHFRPIITVSENDLAALSEEDKEGTYEGIANASLMYEYYRDGTRIRHYVPFPISIKVEYLPDTQIAVELVNPNDDIKPIYFLNQVSGQTTYNLLVTTRGRANLGNGFSMLLHGDSSNKNANSEFSFKELNPSLSGESFQFPFGIYCNKCPSQELVDLDGKKKVQKVEMGQNEDTPYSFDLTVQFENAPLDKLNHGTYQGSFSLVFESLL